MRILTLIVLATSMVSTSAYAHIDLLTPTARYPRGGNKACPCGVGDSNRLCDIPTDRSDPDRAVPGRVTTLVSGSTIKLRFEEYIGHSGRFRVAIDYDGADMADFNQNILVDIPDPAGGAGNTGTGGIWEIDVPLPDMECSNCTLQLIQMMDGDTSNPVLDPIGRSTYYTCADIVLKAAAAPIVDAGPAVEPADAGGQDAGATTPPGGPSAASGSGCQVAHGAASSWLSLALLAGLLALWRRRDRLSSAPIR